MLYNAREKAKKASVKKINAQGWPNRMPYFFKVLRQLCDPQQAQPSPVVPEASHEQAETSQDQPQDDWLNQLRANSGKRSRMMEEAAREKKGA